MSRAEVAESAEADAASCSPRSRASAGWLPAAPPPRDGHGTPLDRARGGEKMPSPAGQCGRQRAVVNAPLRDYSEGPVGVADHDSEPAPDLLQPAGGLAQRDE